MVHVEKSAGMPYVLALMAVSGCTGDPAEPSGGGNFGAAAALRARLQGRAAPAAAAASRRETVVLPQVDARGRAVPGAFGRDAAGAGEYSISMPCETRSHNAQDAVLARL